MTRARSGRCSNNRKGKRRKSTTALASNRRGVVVHLDLGADIAADKAIRQRFQRSIRAYTGVDVPLHRIFCGDVRLTDEQAAAQRLRRRIDPSERAVTFGVAYAVHEGHLYIADILQRFNRQQRDLFCALYIQSTLERLSIDYEQLAMTPVPSADKSGFNHARNYEVRVDGRWSR